MYDVYTDERDRDLDAEYEQYLAELEYEEQVYQEEEQIFLSEAPVYFEARDIFDSTRKDNN